jgi:dethiobiotin synthetase
VVPHLQHPDAGAAQAARHIDLQALRATAAHAARRTLHESAALA